MDRTVPEPWAKKICVWFTATQSKKAKSKQYDLSTTYCLIKEMASFRKTIFFSAPNFKENLWLRELKVKVHVTEVT